MSLWLRLPSVRQKDGLSQSGAVRPPEDGLVLLARSPHSIGQKNWIMGISKIYFEWRTFEHLNSESASGGHFTSDFVIQMSWRFRSGCWHLSSAFNYSIVHEFLEVPLWKRSSERMLSWRWQMEAISRRILPQSGEMKTISRWTLSPRG